MVNENLPEENNPKSVSANNYSNLQNGIFSSSQLRHEALSTEIHPAYTLHAF